MGMQGMGPLQVWHSRYYVSTLSIPSIYCQLTNSIYSMDLSIRWLLLIQIMFLNILSTLSTNIPTNSSTYPLAMSNIKGWYWLTAPQHQTMKCQPPNRIPYLPSIV